MNNQHINEKTKCPINNRLAMKSDGDIDDLIYGEHDDKTYVSEK